MWLFWALLLLVHGTAATAQTASHLIVGDVSGSLKGFAKKAPKQLETLYRVLMRNAENPELAKMPGAQSVVQPLRLNEIGQFASVSTYSAQTTPLDRAITETTLAYSSITIVTDGMESDNLYLRLQDAIIPLAQAGWGIWLVMVTLPFDGKYDLEQPINVDTHYEKMKQCVQQQHPTWQVTVNPNALRTIQFTGERPLLLFILDKNPEQTRGRLLELTKEIERELHRPEIVELSPLYLREYTVTAVEPKSLGVQLVSSAEGGSKVVADPDDGTTIKHLLFRLGWKREAGLFAQPYEEQWLLDRKNRADWAEVQIVKGAEQSKPPGVFSLIVDSEPTWGEWFWRFFSSKSHLRSQPIEFRIGSTLQKPLGGWWQAWSTDTTWECPQKVFKLRSLVERISDVGRERWMKSPPEEMHKLQLQIGAF